MIHEHEELRITHRAFSRKLFASGALVLGRWLSSKTPGTYQLADVSLDQINLP
jgi:4-hydroxy-tetrahydrodipicolinate reductase